MNKQYLQDEVRRKKLIELIVRVSQRQMRKEIERKKKRARNDLSEDGVSSECLGSETQQ